MNAKRKNVIRNCPVCNTKMIIRELECPNCSTILKGFFEFDGLFTLPEEMQEFLITFIKNRGNIKDMEKELNISYPTVRAKIDELLLNLGFPVSKDHEQVSKATKDILTKLEKGEIDAKQALNNLDEI